MGRGFSLGARALNLWRPCGVEKLEAHVRAERLARLNFLTRVLRLFPVRTRAHTATWHTGFSSGLIW